MTWELFSVLTLGRFLFFYRPCVLKIEVQQHTLISCLPPSPSLTPLFPAPCRKAVVSQHQTGLQHPPQTGQQAGADGATGWSGESHSSTTSHTLWLTVAALLAGSYSYFVGFFKRFEIKLFLLCNPLFLRSSSPFLYFQRRRKSELLFWNLSSHDIPKCSCWALDEKIDATLMSLRKHRATACRWLA